MFRNIVKEQLKVPAKIEYLGELRDFVTKVGRRHGFSERIVNAFKLSIDEAATNIIKHAYRDWEGSITIRALLKKNSITIVLIDQGKYFDPRQVGDPDLQRYVEIGKKGGLGIFIMRRLLDSIDYRKTEEGNELWMVKNREPFTKRRLAVPTIPLTLKARYWLISLSIYTVLIIIGYFFLFFRDDDIVLKDYLDRGRQACSVLATEVATSFQGFDPERRQQLIESGSQEWDVLSSAYKPISTLKMSEHRDILYNAFVVDNSNTIIARADEGEILEPFKFPDNVKEIQKNVFEFRQPDGKKVVDIVYPVVDEQDHIMSRAHLFIDGDKIYSDVSKARQNNLSLALFVWVIGVAGLFLLIYIVMNPFRRLQEWVKELGKPGVAEEMDIDSSTEVGEIAQAFSDITQQLKASQLNLAEQERLQKEMQVAQEIQQTLLPSEFPDIEGYDISSYYAAAKEVGGDYFDFVEVDRDTLGIVVADVSGKGVPGSLVMTMIRTALRTEARGIKDAAEVLARVNDFVVNDMKKGMFVTLFYVIIDSKRRRLNFASAGHNPMILFRPSTNNTYYLNPRGFPIGISLPDKHLFRNSIESGTVSLAEDDILIIYTDGITEAMNAKRQLFAEERFLNVVRRFGHLTAGEFVEKLQREIVAFTEGFPQNDDITLVSIKEKSSAEKVELKRAKKVFNLVSEGKSIKEACESVGITTYAYNKYKASFEKEGLDQFTLENEEEQIEARHLSIEEKTKIYDIIRRFPDYGAKRISEELNTERYSFSIISAAKIYEELVRSRLNTKELRKAFIARGGKKRRIKPPGTPMLTIDGKVILQKANYSLPEEEDLKQLESEEFPKQDKKSKDIELDAEITTKPVETEEVAQVIQEFKSPLELLDLEPDSLLLTPLVDLFDKRKNVTVRQQESEPEQPDRVQDRDESDEQQELVKDVKEDDIHENQDDELSSVDDSMDFDFVHDEDDMIVDQDTDILLSEHESVIDVSESEFFEAPFDEERDKVKQDEKASIEPEPDTETDDAILELEADDFSDLEIFDFAGDETEPESEAEKEEEIGDLEYSDTDHLQTQSEKEELDFIDALNAGGGLDEPEKKEEKDEFEGEPVEDIDFIDEESSLLFDEEKDFSDSFDEFIEIIDEEGVISTTGEIEETISEQILENEIKEQINNHSENEFEEEINWDISDFKFEQGDEESVVEEDSKSLSFDELLDFVESDDTFYDEDEEQFEMLLKEALTDKKKMSDHEKFPLDVNLEKDEYMYNKKMEDASKLYSDGSYKKAMELLNTIIQNYPDKWQAHVLRGNALYRQRLYNEAAKEYEKVIKLDFENIEAHENLGVIHANQGDFRRAINQWEQILKISPERQDIRNSIERAKQYLNLS